MTQVIALNWDLAPGLMNQMLLLFLHDLRELWDDLRREARGSLEFGISGLLCAVQSPGAGTNSQELGLRASLPRSACSKKSLCPFSQGQGG